MQESKEHFFQYLDKGYVKVVGHNGDDRMIAKAARASFVSGAYKSDEMNKNLIDYLLYHVHMSPIEMGSITFESKMPMFVARQHVRHRTMKLNEQSLRYVVHDGDYYLPELDRMHLQSSDNKQGSGDLMPPHIAEARREMLRQAYEDQWQRYRLLIDEREEVDDDGKVRKKCHGLTKELARSILGTAFYTTIVWQMDVRNLAHYLKLRLDPHAQWEIREHAKLVAEAYKDLFPWTYEAVEENLLHSVTLSRKEVEAVRSMLAQMSDDEKQEVAKNVGIRPSRMTSFLNKLK